MFNRNSRRKPQQRQLRFEALEDRRVLAAVTVGTISDIFDVAPNISIAELIAPNGAGLDGKISLREAIIAANNTPLADTINFDFTLNGLTIKLGEDELGMSTGVFTQLNITDTLTIDASMLVSGLTIDGNDPDPSAGRTGVRIFNITNIPNAGLVTIDGLTLSGADPNETDGPDLAGGAIRTEASLTLLNSFIQNNHANGVGGGVAIIANDATDTFLIQNTEFSGNDTDSNGGGLSVKLSGGSLTIEDSTFHMNTADDSGGGIASSALTLYALAA